MCSSIRVAHRKHGIRAAAVDYLQLLEMSGARTEEEEIGRASKGFKNLAEELEIPIILLVQVNRRCEERADKRPVMSDIRGSGRVEQDADAVVFVYREAYYNERFARPNQVELLVRANRHGPAGTGIAFWKRVVQGPVTVGDPRNRQARPAELTGPTGATPGGGGGVTLPWGR